MDSNGYKSAKNHFFKTVGQPQKTGAKRIEKVVIRGPFNISKKKSPFP